MNPSEITQPPRVPSRYCGQLTAWNREQTQIVASGPTLLSARDAAVAAGELQPILTKAPDAKVRFVGGVRRSLRTSARRFPPRHWTSPSSCITRKSRFA